VLLAVLVDMQMRQRLHEGDAERVPDVDHRLDEMRDMLLRVARGRRDVFTSGWISNLAAISTIADLLPNCVILSDASNHDSMIEGVKRSRAERKVFRHNDLALSKSC
jgi:5-aminolevulinate synthase